VDPYETNVCKISFEHDVDTSRLHEIEEIVGIRVSITKFKKPLQAAQCYRCQRLGHTKNYCELSPNCVKCGQPHASRECPKPYEATCTCFLCGGTHPASFLGCPAHKEARKTLISRKTARHPPARRADAAFSYAAAASASASDSQFPQLIQKQSPAPTTAPTASPSAPQAPQAPASDTADLWTWFCEIQKELASLPTVIDKKITYLDSVSSYNVSKPNAATRHQQHKNSVMELQRHRE
jgi:hypothetical protein